MLSIKGHVIPIGQTKIGPAEAHIPHASHFHSTRLEHLQLNLVGGTLEPEQLYLHDTRTNLPLFDNSSTNGFASVLDLLEETFGGKLEKSSDGRGTKYTVRITDYINDIVVRDSILSPLNLSLSSSLLITSTLEAESAMGQKVDLPVMNTLNPFGTVLFGNNVPVEDEDKKLKLQIFYTEID